MIKPAVIAYVPPPQVGCSKEFWANINRFKTKFPFVIYSDHDWPDAIRLRGSPEQAKGALYQHGKPNPWAVNNLVFLTGLRIAISKGFTHILYLESDCRVNGDGWDEIVFNEFFDAGEGKLVAGSIACYQPCSASLEFTLAWRNFIARYVNSPFPIPAYGGAGAAEAQEPAVFPNGALGVYDIRYLSTVFNVEDCNRAAAESTAWDYQIGRAMVRQFGKEVFTRIAHLSSIYSGYGNVMFTEEDRQRLLTDKTVVAVHQIKSNWTPDGGVAELVRRAGDEEKEPAIPTTAQSHVGSSPTAPTARQPSYECVSIYVVTFGKDAEWLKYCLKSIDKFCVGFKHIVVVYPNRDEDIIAPICGNRPKLIRKTYTQHPDPYGHLHHQAIKCLAHEFDNEADFFLYVDSDCIFTEPVTPDDYFVDGKPVLLVESYLSLTNKKDGAVVWQGVTEKALGMPCPFETMRRHPAVHYTTTCARMVNHIQKVHGLSFLSYVLTQKPNYPQGFSEFNALGSWVLKNARDNYHIIDVGAHPEQRPKEKLLQMWSHGPMEKPQEVWFDGKLQKIVPIDMIQKVLS